MIRIYLPKFLYETLPFFCILFGLFTVSDVPTKFLFLNAILIFYGVWILIKRHNFRCY